MTEKVLEGGDCRSEERPRFRGPRPEGAVEVRADFNRSLVTVLGLPFDAVTLVEAVDRIRQHAFAGERCFVSTPNLNFAVAALSDPLFRNTVLRSDLSLVDGMPLVWIARACGTPVPERVAGSDVFEALQAHPGPPIDVYLFGGPEGAGAEACAAINERGGGMRCVGFDPAGFGSIESMSSDDRIDRINRSRAHFVMVSLGAKKGQAWLEHNASRLEAPVLAHLGAVLNFAAGTVRRAPGWMRWSGLEWLWRIKEEPSLWRRYWGDGSLAIGVLLRCVVPDIVASRFRRQGSTFSRPALIESERSQGVLTLRLGGSWTDDAIALLRPHLARSAMDGVSLQVDLSDVDTVSSAFVGLLLVAKGWFGSRSGFRVTASNPMVRAILRRKLAEKALLE